MSRTIAARTPQPNNNHLACPRHLADGLPLLRIERPPDSQPPQGEASTPGAPISLHASQSMKHLRGAHARSRAHLPAHLAAAVGHPQAHAHRRHTQAGLPPRWRQHRGQRLPRLLRGRLPAARAGARGHHAGNAAGRTERAECAAIGARGNGGARLGTHACVHSAIHGACARAWTCTHTIYACVTLVCMHAMGKHPGMVQRGLHGMANEPPARQCWY